MLAATMALPCVFAAQPAGSFDVRDFGAKGDGENLDTTAIYAAIDSAVAGGGGTVYFPAGKYLTGSVHLQSNLTLYLDQGAELIYSGNPEHSPVVKTRWEGTEVYTYSPLIFADGKENIAVVGHGTLNGMGVNWWWRTTEDPARKEIAMPGKLAWKALLNRIEETGYEPIQADFSVAMHYLRPSLLQPINCRNVHIEGITLLDSPMWMLHPIYCDDVQIRGVRFLSHGPNGDGIDIDSCRNVRISDCFFDTYDDCIVIKSGRDGQGRRIGRPTEMVTITNCVMYRGNGAVMIGSEMSGGVRNVVASNIVCYGTDRGIRLKTARGRGAVVENIRFDNWLIVDAPLEAIHITSNYADLPEEPFSERTPVMRDIAISNVTVRNAAKVLVIDGLPEQAIERIRLTDIVGSGREGLSCNLGRDVALRNVRIDCEQGPPFFFSDSSDLSLDDLGTRDASNEPVVALHNTRDVWLRNSRAVKGNKAFVQVMGAKTRNIVVSGNELSEASKSVAIGPDVPEGRVTERE